MITSFNVLNMNNNMFMLLLLPIMNSLFLIFVSLWIQLSHSSNSVNIGSFIAIGWIHIKSFVEFWFPIMSVILFHQIFMSVAFVFSFFFKWIFSVIGNIIGVVNSSLLSIHSMVLGLSSVIQLFGSFTGIFYRLGKFYGNLKNPKLFKMSQNLKYYGRIYICSAWSVLNSFSCRELNVCKLFGHYYHNFVSLHTDFSMSKVLNFHKFKWDSFMHKVVVKIGIILFLLVMVMYMSLFLFNIWNYISIGYVGFGGGLALGLFNMLMGVVVVVISSLVLMTSIDYLDLLYTIYFLILLSLFQLFMLGFCFTDSLLVMYINWDWLGMVSYLLINLYFNSQKNGLKAIIFNKLGDIFFLIVMAYFMYHFLPLMNFFPLLSMNLLFNILILMIFSSVSSELALSSSFSEVSGSSNSSNFHSSDKNVDNLLVDNKVEYFSYDNMSNFAFTNSSFSETSNNLGMSHMILGSSSSFSNLETFSSIGYNYLLISVGLLVVFFTKSAQLPFSSWLMNAMAAPTPVSSLLHSSTMVIMGVFLCLLLSPTLYVLMDLFNLMNILFINICALTLLWSLIKAFSSNNMKSIIAYSTVNQLSYMFLSMKMSSLIVLFHIVVHAFFKCMLFLMAGSLIHTSLNFQNIFKMSYFQFISYSAISSSSSFLSFKGNFLSSSNFNKNSSSRYNVSNKMLYISFLIGSFMLAFALSKELIIMGLMNVISSSFLYLLVLVGALGTIIYSSILVYFIFFSTSFSCFESFILASFLSNFSILNSGFVISVFGILVKSNSLNLILQSKVLFFLCSFVLEFLLSKYIYVNIGFLMDKLQFNQRHSLRVSLLCFFYGLQVSMFNSDSFTKIYTVDDVLKADSTIKRSEAFELRDSANSSNRECSDHFNGLNYGKVSDLKLPTSCADFSNESSWLQFDNVFVDGKIVARKVSSTNMRHYPHRFKK